MKRASALGLALPLLLCLTPTLTQAQQAAPPSAAPGPFNDVPAASWIYNAFKTLQDAKIVIGYPDGTYSGRRPMTRYEFATAIARLLPLLMPPTKDAALSEEQAALRQDLQTKLQENQPAQDALMRLVEEFGPELTALGQDVPVAEARLAALRPISPPFPDMPKDHWAYQSVETLRKAGIVTGEPDGKFHG